MRMALIQRESGIDSALNRASIGDQLAQLAPGTVDVVVLPEASMHDFGAADHDLAAVAEPLDGPFVQLLGQHARRLGASVIAGMFEATDDLPFNTLAVVGPDGSLDATYRKIHLYDSFGYRESDRLSAGPTTPAVVQIAGHAVGLMTCYDLRFPELSRQLVEEGAQALIIPAAWVAGEHKLHHWRTLVTARAIENTVVVAAVGQCGPRYTGHSLVVDAMGSIVEEAAGARAIVTVTLDFDAVRHARTVNPSLANRRIFYHS